MSADENRLRRARALLACSTGWIDEADDGLYPVRTHPDRRRRMPMRLTEAEFLALTADPGLKVRVQGGWTSVRAPRSTPDLAGRPGMAIAERILMDTEGAEVGRRTNLGQCPLDLLARRRDATGEPWLSKARHVAGNRLRLDAERASAGGPTTMRWGALPRTASGTSMRVEPPPSAHAAGRRVARALAAIRPRARPVVETVCLAWTGLQTLEAQLGLRRQEGRDLLNLGLGDLAVHYGLE